MADPAVVKRKLCPICGKEAQRAFRPFCSRRCADVDLHRWLAGAYAMPATEAKDDLDGATADAPARPSGQT